jgi:hypothetical protein
LAEAADQVAAEDPAARAWHCGSGPAWTPANAVRPSFPRWSTSPGNS